MKLAKCLKSLAVAGAALGILVPHPAISTASENLAANRRAESVRDLALGAGGLLRGQVVTKEGLPKRDATVTILQEGGTLATTKTDENGVFAVTGLSGGVYAITSGKSSGVVRAWSHQTAPPAASQGILIVPSDLTVRGQGRLHQLLNGPNGPSFSQIGLGGLFVLGFLGTVIAVSLKNDAS